MAAPPSACCSIRECPSSQLGAARSQPGAPVAAGTWSHLAVVADGKTLQLFLNGEPYATLDGALPALTTPALSSAAAPTPTGFTGELDEFPISKTARSAGWVKLASVNQGSTDAAQRTPLVRPGRGRRGGGAQRRRHGARHALRRHRQQHDVRRLDRHRRLRHHDRRRLDRRRQEVPLSQLHREGHQGLPQPVEIPLHRPHRPRSRGQVQRQQPRRQGRSRTTRSSSKKSPLYHIYHIGSEEIRHRLDKDNNRVQGLSGRSIQAIRASLDAGLVHESHRLIDGLVYLTISIAGGPYVGLLGTVVGVMITFAIIAKSGEVNVNSIAPGIASALLATVVGLVVAIPALFIYSYLNGRIKNVARPHAGLHRRVRRQDGRVLPPRRRDRILRRRLHTLIGLIPELT